MKILSSADWHINLHKKKVPFDWQQGRFLQFFKELYDLEKECDVHIISGDLFDKKPSPDEVCLLLSYLNSVKIPTYIIPGNHEATRKGESFWEFFTLDNTINNPLVSIFTKNTRVPFENIAFQFFPYGELQLDNLPAYSNEDILVTHIRGEVPPHITAEYDFEKLRSWKLVLLGDLHFNHQYKDFPIYYPGSPLNTTFDRDDKREYGVDIFELNSIDDYKKVFIDLKLPKLLRKTVTSEADMVADPYNHTIYEVTGTIDELAKISKSDLLDKKIVEKPNSESTLDLKDKNIYEELDIYLDYIKISNVEEVVEEFKTIHIEAV